MQLVPDGRWRSVAQQAAAGTDSDTRSCIVTGANSGVGLETARQLVKQAGHVVMACRRVEAGEEAARSFAGLSGTHEVMRLDLADLESVREFVAALCANHDRLDGLACNAGMVNMRGGLERTRDGFESTIAVSYLGHFLLTELLLDTLRATAPSRMAIVSSFVHARKPQEPAPGGARRPQLPAARLQRHARLQRGRGPRTVAPTTGERRPVANPVVALDAAEDRARCLEALERWQPDGIVRAW